MKLRPFSYLLLVVAAWVLLGLVGLVRVRHNQPILAVETVRIGHARHPVNQADSAAATLPIPQVVMGTPEAYTPPPEATRYTYRNEFPEDRSKTLPLYLIDTETGAETRLGDDSDAAFFSTLNDEHLVWFFGGFHVYNLVTGQDVLLSKIGNPGIHPQLFGDSLAFGNYNGGGSQEATLYAANIQSQEVITLTRNLPAGNDRIRGYFGISDALATWYEDLNTIVVYDLNARQEITRLTHINAVFNETYLDVYDLSPGETVVTWSRDYGYDLVTRSYFRLGRLAPPDWDNARIRDISRIQERDRTLSWTFYMRDGSQRHVRAPLLDATPSTALCIENQNLVQNGDLESTADHALWQQRDNQANLLINDPPPGLATGGQWAIRLGRINNSSSSIQQTLNIPSHVKGITLAFDIRAHSWDLWGGDQLQVDLVDPITGASILATPVQWTNVQLASGGWIPLQVDIQDWPGIDTPLQLVLRAQTDWAFPTDFTVDNIAFTTTCQ